MVSKCAVRGCGAHFTKFKPESNFFRIPSEFELRSEGKKVCRVRQLRRKRWLEVINNPLIKDYEGARVCGRHFIQGKPASLLEQDHPDWVPKLYIQDGASKPTLAHYMKEIIGLSETKPEHTKGATAVGQQVIDKRKPDSPSPEIAQKEISPTILSQNDTDLKEISQNHDATNVELPANMVRDGLGKIWLTNKDGKIEKEKDGVILVVDPKNMTVTARIISRF